MKNKEIKFPRTRTKEIILEKVRIGIATAMADAVKEDLKYDIMRDEIIQRTIHAFRTWVWGEELENRVKTITFTRPKNWWNMFKEQYFPRWLLKHFPVEYMTTKKTVRFRKLATYPQLPLVLKGKGNVGHIRYVTEMYEE